MKRRSEISIKAEDRSERHLQGLKGDCECRFCILIEEETSKCDIIWIMSYKTRTHFQKMVANSLLFEIIANIWLRYAEKNIEKTTVAC